MNIHEAKIHDIEQLANHHRKMFEEIWEKKNLNFDSIKAQEIESAYSEKLRKQLLDGRCKAWLAKNGSQVVASGAISIFSYIPVPNDTNLEVAYLHSMYTEKIFRGRKIAQQIIEKAISYCKVNGIHRIALNASDEGKPIYEKIGFLSAPDSMRLFIK